MDRRDCSWCQGFLIQDGPVLILGLTELFPQQLAGAIQTREHGSQRNLQRLGRLPAGMPRREDQEERLPQFRCERLQGLLQAFLVGQLLQWCQRLGLRAIQGKFLAGEPFMALIAHKVGMAETENLVEPGAGAGGITLLI